jgi:DNA-binding response OmpR family regulator
MLKQLFLLSKTDFIYNALSDALEQDSVHLFHLPVSEEWTFYFEDMNPEALLLDYDGVKEHSALRGKLKTIDVPIFVLVNPDQIDEANQAYGDVMAGSIPKPINPFELKGIISTKLNYNH